VVFARREHLEGRVTILYGPHVVARQRRKASRWRSRKNRAHHAVEMTRRGKRGKVKRRTFPLFPPRLEIRPNPKPPDFHIPTASTAADSQGKTRGAKKRQNRTDQVL